MKGGTSMAAERASCLRFSLEELVWFKRGQEVSELLSISLEPDITIQENDEYVTVRGALNLTGEYHPKEVEGDEGEINTLREQQSSSRTVDYVEGRQDGITNLSHRFPVDITIPRSRVRNLDDIYVTVESFDYEIPESGCLELKADLAISGIQGAGTREEKQVVDEEEVPEYSLNLDDEVEEDVQEEYIAEEVEEEVVEEEQPAAEEKKKNKVAKLFGRKNQSQQLEEAEEESLFEPFEAEARKSMVDDVEDVKDSIEAIEDKDLLEDEALIEKTEEKYTVDEDQPSFLEDTTDEIERTEEKYTVEEATTDEIEEESRENSKSPLIEMKGRVDFDEEDKEDDQEEHVPTNREDENALYLTKMLAKEEEEEFSRLKMYITQDGDSLHAIAERYEVSVTHLLNANRLDSEAVGAGQILYIPASAQ